MPTDNELFEDITPDPSWPYTPLYEGLREVRDKAKSLIFTIGEIEEPNETDDTSVQKKLTEIKGIIDGLTDTFWGKSNAH